MIENENKELQIDEEHMQKYASAINELRSSLKSEVLIMLDKEEDLFLRYMAYIKLRTIGDAINFSEHISINCLQNGHIINHPIMQTSEHKLRGWDKIRIKDHPFFVQEEKPTERDMRLSFSDLVRGLDAEKFIEEEKEKEKNH